MGTTRTRAPYPWPESLSENDGISLPDPFTVPLIPLHVAGFYLQQSRTVTWRQEKDGTFPLDIIRLLPRRPSVRTVDLYRFLAVPLPVVNGSYKSSEPGDD